MKLIIAVQVALLLVGLSEAFSPRFRSGSVVRKHVPKLYSTQEQRDEAMANYLLMADQEAIETFLRVRLCF